MNLLQKVERLLQDKFRYRRYYCSVLLTLLGLVGGALTYRIDQLSHQTVDHIDELYRLLAENQTKLTDRDKTYRELEKELKGVRALVREIVRALTEKKILDAKDRLFNYYYDLTDPTHPAYAKLDGLICGEESAGSSASTKVPHANLKIYCEVARLFWDHELTNQTIAFIDEIHSKLLKFMGKYDLFTPLLPKLTPKLLMCIIDPQRQHIISANNLTEFFQQLTRPDIIERLLEQPTLQSPLSLPVQRLQNNLRLKFRNKLQVKSNLHDGDIIQLNSDRVILNDGKTIPNRHPSLTVFGASSTNQILLKHKWISRVQFIVISDPTESGYFVVCASTSNSTCLVRNTPTPLTQEMLFKIGPSSFFSVFKLQSLEQQLPATFSDTDKTVTHMPNSSDKIRILQLQLQFLTGKFKDKFATIRHEIGSSKLQYTIGPNPTDDVYCEHPAVLTVVNDATFEISSGAEILLKASSERNSQRPSRRHRLCRTNRVYFDECELEVLNDV